MRNTHRCKTGGCKRTWICRPCLPRWYKLWLDSASRNRKDFNNHICVCVCVYMENGDAVVHSSSWSSSMSQKCPPACCSTLTHTHAHTLHPHLPSRPCTVAGHTAACQRASVQNKQLYRLTPWWTQHEFHKRKFCHTRQNKALMKKYSVLWEISDLKVNMMLVKGWRASLFSPFI